MDQIATPHTYSLTEDAPQDAELLLCTHMTVVVRARCIGADMMPRELGVVVARQHCDGDRPQLRALMEAARRAAARARASCIEARIGGRWVTLLEEEEMDEEDADDIDVGEDASLKGISTMNASKTPIASRFGAAAAASLLALTGASQALAGTPQQNYQQERANCMNGNTTQDRATCLREAGAALQEARRNGLVTPSPRMMTQNAVQRCQRQPDKEDRADCERLALGQGTQEGSVGEGAIVREIATLQTQPTGAGNRGK
ncbi:hypothetical protein SNE35_12710 [Paucibacter sp. R3-3]|uniref:Uncharacterized protein n=1 Tax=Roseateles agri TaxID=3098619 RepID=A0ABU5DGG3_9BURK|nr:hypothetical protein [Paucibacter sp. R3-3]MDY0745375.1 hypothetical protein [Paucibacter sp. R3-3]